MFTRVVGPCLSPWDGFRELLECFCALSGEPFGLEHLMFVWFLHTKMNVLQDFHIITASFSGSFHPVRFKPSRVNMFNEAINVLQHNHDGIFDISVHGPKAMCDAQNHVS